MLNSEYWYLSKKNRLSIFSATLHPRRGSEIISNGWKVVFITENFCSGSQGLGFLDPFQVTDPLANENSNTEIRIPSTKDENIDFFVTRKPPRGWRKRWLLGKHWWGRN